MSEADQQTVWQAMVLIRNKLNDANDVITIRSFTQSDIEGEGNTELYCCSIVNGRVSG